LYINISDIESGKYYFISGNDLPEELYYCSKVEKIDYGDVADEGEKDHDAQLQHREEQKINPTGREYTFKSCASGEKLILDHRDTKHYKIVEVENISEHVLGTDLRVCTVSGGKKKSRNSRSKGSKKSRSKGSRKSRGKGSRKSRRSK